MPFSDDHDFENVSWSEVKTHMNDILEPYGDIPKYPVHFYGNDGVCLFKYFYRQRQSRGKGHEDVELKSTRKVTVSTMLIVNSVCFIIIAVCYIGITWKAKKSTQESGQHDNPERLRENKAMQNRIILIIVTDFLCWVPFIIISGMHNFSDSYDFTNWYTPFAMTVLPLNSVINPLLYDKILLEFIKKLLRQPWQFLTSRLRNFSFRSAIPGLFRRSN